MLKLLKIFIITSLLCVSLFGQDKLSKVTLQLKWFTSFQFAGYYMALEKGYYKDVGIDVEILERDPSQNNIEQVIKGEAEYGIADSAILLYRAKNEPVKILASIYQHSPLILIAKKSSNILSPFEMKGKTISYEKELDDSPIMAMFKYTGIDEDQYTYKPLDFTYQEFINGDVDVISSYITDQPYLFQELGIEINIINPLNYGIDFYGDNLFTTESEILKHPQRVKDFTKASLKGWKYALEHKEETIRVLREQYGSKRSIEHLRYEAAYTQKLMVTDVVDIGYTSIERFRRIANIYLEVGEINEDELQHAIDELIYNPNIVEKVDTFYYYLFFALLSGMSAVIIIFYLFNRHLQLTVQKKTKDLLEQQETVDKYVIMVETNKNGVIKYVSTAFCDISGYQRFELVNKKNSIVRHPDTPISIYKDLWETIKKGKSWSGEIKNRKKDGTSYWLLINIDSVYDSKGRHVAYRSIMQDISDRKLAEELAVTDALTGIYNRLHLDRILETELQRSKRHHNALSVILIDIDNFKDVNDIYGHLVGDIILKEISHILRSNIRNTDTLGRWGGEEFLIILPNTELESAKVLAQKIRESIQKYDFSVVHTRTGSFGVAGWKEYDTKDTLIKRADEALYRAKKDGRNVVKVEEYNI